MYNVALLQTYQKPQNQVAFLPNTFHAPKQCPMLYLKHKPLYVMVQALCQSAKWWVTHQTGGVVQVVGVNEMLHFKL